MSQDDNTSTPLSQDAFRKGRLTDEDKFFHEREREILEDLKDSRAARAELERRCPVCAEQILDRVMHENVEIDTCPQCKGVWLDAGELDLLTGRAKRSQNGLVKFFRELAGDYDD